MHGEENAGARSDDFGRLVEVVEPGPTSNGSVTASGNLKTAYTYDAVDQLTQITQGSQIRKFKYDSLGRMTRQKLAEQTATINDSGTYVGSGGSGATWSDSFSYDNRSNLTQRTDARGVKTNFQYMNGSTLDPLNRLRAISFDTSGSDTSHGTIHPGAYIAYTYMTTGDKERLSRISASGVYNEDFNYDVDGRLTYHVTKLNSRPSNLMVSQYVYDTANRLTSVVYPKQYGMAGDPRKTVNIAYDQTSRLKDLKVGTASQMDQISYNDFGQATSIRIGGATANPLTETYEFDSNNGLMTRQKVKRGTTSLMDLSYNYNRIYSSKGTLSGKTGNLTHMVNNLDRNEDRIFEYDALGRLIKARGGAATGAPSVTANWTQDYAYDRYGNKTTTTKSGITANSAAIPLDGLASQTYQASSNRITTSGHEYDNAGNMTRGKAPDGLLQRFEYDAAGRVVKIKTDAGALLEEYTYGSSRERIKKTVANGDKTYYAWGGSSVLVEYTEASAATTMSWSKSYVYAGSRLLSTIKKNGASELTEYQHPDRLGTKLITDTTANTAKSQATLPFGALINAETDATSNQRFTSYDRSGATGLDYAINRTYNSGQSRFTQVDPIGMASADPGDPQSLNMFAYTQNNPVDFVDPSGLDSSLADAIKLVRQVIKNRACASLFSRYIGKGKRRKIKFFDPTKLLALVLRKNHLQVKSNKYPVPTLFRNGKPIKYKMDSFGDSVATTIRVRGRGINYRRIFINKNGAFFNGKDIRVGNSLLNFQANTIIHELLHYIDANGNRLFTNKDGNNAALSHVNYELIDGFCFGSELKPIVADQGEIGTSITLPRGGRGNGDHGFGKYKQADSFRSLNWWLFERWARDVPKPHIPVAPPHEVP